MYRYMYMCSAVVQAFDQRIHTYIHNLQLAYKYQRPHRMDWHAVSGSVKSLVGTYEFVRLGKSLPKLTFSAYERERERERGREGDRERERDLVLSACWC
jgi:hypothetical protein